MTQDNYEKRLTDAKTEDMERILEEIEEAHYMDGSIDYERFIFLSRMFQKLSGDYSILNHDS